MACLLLQASKYYMLNYFKNLFGKNTEYQGQDTDDINVIWIHGANQTSLSFQYIRQQTNFSKEIFVNYSSMNRFNDNLDQIVEEVQGRGPHFVIGHSLGGLYALHLTQYVRVLGGVSISTPFRGSSTADWAKYIVPSYPLFKDIGRKSDPVTIGNKIKLDIPWTQIVSTTGSVPYHNGPNDGVVTLASMKHRDDMEHIEVPHTHYETMCSDRVAEIILDRYNKITSSRLLIQNQN
jgi:pimeloyl-ACP methyl ester carboxylesterase